MVAFSVPDLEAAVKKLQFHEVDLPWGVEINATERWVMFHDPAGNLIELVEALETRLKNKGWAIIECAQALFLFWRPSHDS